MRIDALLRESAIDQLEARILIAHALQWTRIELVTRSQDELNDVEIAAAKSVLQRRREGEPVAYITGEREFFGLKLKVTPAVLIPRHETELLVEQAAQHLHAKSSVLDLGTGSGAVALALGHLRGDARITATDISLAALDIAQQNATTHNIAINFLQSDWYDSVKNKYDLIVSNPPYIPAGDVHLTQGDLRFEPADALTDYSNGLKAIELIIRGAPHHLEDNGWLLLEHGYDQAQAVSELFRNLGWHDVHCWSDLAGIPRVTGAQFN